MVDIFTWGLLVPMLEANPDPVKVAHARELFYNFFSYNTVRAHARAGARRASSGAWRASSGAWRKHSLWGVALCSMRCVELSPSGRRERCLSNC
jgi:hypothetical protein